MATDSDLGERVSTLFRSHHQKTSLRSSGQGYVWSVGLKTTAVKRKHNKKEGITLILTGLARSYVTDVLGYDERAVIDQQTLMFLSKQSDEHGAHFFRRTVGSTTYLDMSKKTYERLLIQCFREYGRTIIRHK